MRDLKIVMPAYNEEKALSFLLPKLIAYCQEKGCRLVIVNDGSTDGTKEMLEQCSAFPFFVPITHKVNRGYDGALKTGMNAAQTPYVLTMDADGQHQLQDIAVLYDALRNNDLTWSWAAG